MNLSPGGRNEGREVVQETARMQTSVRSIVVGGLIGGLVSASAMYLSFKAGSSFSSAMFCGVVGFAILKPLSTRLPTKFGGGYFGPKENATLQTAGNSASGLSAGFTVAIPVLYWIGFLKRPISNDLLSLFLWTLAAAYYGLFFAVPLRELTILKQKLRFPSGTATALVIETMHSSVDKGEREGIRKARRIIICFAISFIYVIFSHFFPVFGDLPFFWYLYKISGADWTLKAHKWRWSLSLSPAMLGIGMVMGANAGLSLLLGGVLCWGVLGPLTQRAGWTFANYGYSGDFIARPSVQYWLLWPGITIMITSALFELAWNYKVIVRGIVEGTRELRLLCRRGERYHRVPDAPSSGEPAVNPDTQHLLQSRLDSDGQREEEEGGEARNDKPKEEESDEDPAPPEERVPFAWWFGGLTISTIFTVVVLSTFWKAWWVEVFLAVLLSFVLSYMAVQVYGETDNNPQGTVAKASQFVFAAINKSQAINVLCGNIALCAAGQAGDMLQDLKTGHVLRASPRAQFISQIFGSLFGVFSNIAAFYLISSAYPCLMELPNESDPCPFAMPSAQSWFGVSYALTAGFKRAVPPSSAWACLISVLLALILGVIRKKAKKGWSISPMALGLALTFPQPNLMLTMAAGSVLMRVWELRSNKSWEEFAFVTAAGMMTGDGMGGIVGSILVLANVKWTSTFGMPK